jgi:hypothetical protein
MPPFRSTFFINSAEARLKKQVGQGVEINRDIEEWIKKVQNTVDDFNKKDRKRILVKAARVVVKAARSRTPEGTVVHYRYQDGKKIKYNPKNLRRSIKRLRLNKSTAAFVGPEFSRSKVLEYGGVGQPSDGYYAGIIFGSQAAFKRQVLQPAASAAESQVRSEVAKESLRIIKNRAASRGIKTR